MTASDTARLRTIYQREFRSLLQYVPGAAAYAGPDQKLLEVVLRLADEEASALQMFDTFLDDQRIIPPPSGAFPAAFTDLNFVTIRSLLPKLITEQRQDLAALQADHQAMADAAARVEVGRLVELHQRHLAELEGLAA